MNKNEAGAILWRVTPASQKHTEDGCLLRGSIASLTNPSTIPTNQTKNTQTRQAMTQGTLITTYKSYAIREAAQNAEGISLGVDVYFYGAFVFNAPNVAQAKSRIDYAIATDSEKLNDFPQVPASVTTTAPDTTLTLEQRKAANMKKERHAHIERGR